MLGDVLLLAMFYYSVLGIGCVELFKGKYQYRCGVPNFSGAYEELNANSDLVFTNITYTVNNVVQLCRGPMPYQQTWDNSSGE